MYLVMTAFGALVLVGKAAAADYESWEGMNCYEGHGGTDIDKNGVTVSSVEECEARCDADARCFCVVHHRNSSNGNCWKRSLCEPDRCVHSTSKFDSYIKAGAPTPAPPPTPPAPSMPGTYTVSGFSAGASLALFHFVAFSSEVGGLGLIGASPYGCNLLPEVYVTCGGMNNPNHSLAWYENAWNGWLNSTLKTYISDRFERGLLDAPAHMKGKPVWMFSGQRDDVVNQTVMRAVEAQLHEFTSTIKTVYHFKSEHAWIVDNSTCSHPGKELHVPPATQQHGPYCGVKWLGHVETQIPRNQGGCCGVCDAGAPGSENGWWRPPINNCGYDMAEDMLRSMVPSKMGPAGGLAPKSRGLIEHLHAFNQSLYVPVDGRGEPRNLSDVCLDDTAFVYVPEQCKGWEWGASGKGKGSKCEVHIHYHCCQCDHRVMGRSLMMQCGILDWAESNGIIVLFPQTATDGKCGGCWDWTGLTSYEFDTHEGLQLRTMRSMLIDLPDIVHKAAS